jgi:hypothetical protein
MGKSPVFSAVNTAHPSYMVDAAKRSDYFSGFLARIIHEDS